VGIRVEVVGGLVEYWVGSGEWVGSDGVEGFFEEVKDMKRV